MEQADIGVVGLAVMGQNLALNIRDHGYRVAVYNRTTARTESFAASPEANHGILPCFSIDGLALALKRPRKILLMVSAGKAVDDTLGLLVPHLEAGDIIIDGGNSHPDDTRRRSTALSAQKLLFVGCGISGGEQGARHGPSLMPGGNPDAWPHIRPIFEAIAARVDGQPCCRWIGPQGAGHFVKMVHNGIEYGDLQLIGETYHLLRSGLHMSPEQLSGLFHRWNRGPLNSYLIDITARILSARDDDGTPLIDKILDTAGQKGTGRWTAIEALKLNTPLTTINEAVFARNLSARREERLLAAQQPAAPLRPWPKADEETLQFAHDALYASKIISYAQGFMLLKDAASAYDWDLDYRGIALIWRGGCIIRSIFLDDIAAAFDADPELQSLLLAPFFAGQLRRAETGWRQALTLGIGLGIPLPAMAASLTFFDGYRCARLPANLLQAQRDFFGAHTYERTDRPRGTFFHTDWDPPDE
ncbi:decarboxylating NADP(+)-dependent phosphogluconate dehydrogenase [Syntrophotalea acetylenica]|jgi:6-phosphogluconate dehydrogenase|uniref:6-phosphogluconate dehydrogenase, decarboxylating n=1 Tax=Syntrophotalea acetylenica TaxID=29542 RepID=A0A1L3GH72_SYNAC|nr:decarboxylating NADP(+)-dependent phosphogluconate dehydrogenase [Syntrophotalea acetylenica]APG25286.1 phosphogluconate dehydrogenase (NADP(+)-dependent, decarboxylating) [Syntrophotalea acetylenica]APG43355.1 phosphogluconate dehydrogenase (NADP(+)-dependent, decarboxylating) [Syntrophotalea acetylenica]